MPETTYYAIALSASAAVSLAVALLAWRRRSVPGSIYFSLMMLAVAEWSAVAAIEAVSADQNTKIIWAQISYVGISIAPTLLLFFALNYWRPNRPIRRLYQILLWIIPLATIAIAATNGLHHLLWDSFTPESPDTNTLIYGHAVWFWVNVAYSYAVMLASIVLLSRVAVGLPPLYRRQVLVVLIAAILPWIGNALYVFGGSPLPGLDVAPIAFSVTGLILALGILKLQLFDLVPVARENMLQQIDIGMLVLDYKSRIVDFNSAAGRIIVRKLEVGQHIEEVLEGWQNMLSLPVGLNKRREVLFEKRKPSLWLEVGISPLHARSNRRSGHLITLQDITERKRAEQAVRASEERLRQFIDLLPEAICEMDAFGNLLFANHVAFIMTGYDRKDLERGVNIFPMIAAEDQDRAANNIQRMIAGEALGADEYTLIRKDGTRFPALVHISNVLDGEGKTAGFRGIVIDITERRRAEELRQRLAAIVESSHDAIIGQQLDGIITSWNKGAEARYGYSAAEAVGRSISMLISPERAGDVASFLDEKIRQGEAVIDYETECITKDGRRITTLVTISPIKDASGKVVGGSSIAQDITERKLVEEVRQRLASIVESSHDAIISKGLDGIIASWNKGAEMLYGYSAEEVIGRPISIIIPPELIGEEPRFIEKVRNGEAVKDYQTTRITKYDRRITVLLTVSPVRDATGRIVGASAIARDITYLKWVEEALRESEQKYREMSDLLPQTIFEIDAEGRFIYVNKYGLKSSGYTWDEIEKGINAIEMFVPEQRKRLLENIGKVLMAEPFDDHEYTIVNKDGSTYPALVYSTAVVRNGKTVGLRGIVLDITERKKIEQMKTDFVSFISHQLRTPVAGLMAGINNMIDGITGELNNKQREYLFEMRDVCARNNRLIADLLNISRLERGVLSVNKQRVSLRGIVDLAVQEYGDGIRESGLALDIKEIDRDVFVLADSDKLVEVLKNVIHNAYKFTKEGSIGIEISIRENEGVVKAKDTGIGMTEAVMRDLFKREKVFGGAVATGGGAGLGLYIAKGFMQLQGGDITVESVVGKGSTFIISLPRE